MAREEAPRSVKPLILPEPFTGGTDYCDWIENFENVAAVNGWDEAVIGQGPINWESIHCLETIARSCPRELCKHPYSTEKAIRAWEQASCWVSDMQERKKQELGRFCWGSSKVGWQGIKWVGGGCQGEALTHQLLGPDHWFTGIIWSEAIPS